MPHAGDAPSVLSPEIAIPSADASGAPLSRVLSHTPVLGPESFRGGCSFGIERTRFSRRIPQHTRRVSDTKQDSLAQKFRGDRRTNDHHNDARQMVGYDIGQIDTRDDGQHRHLCLPPR